MNSYGFNSLDLDWEYPVAKDRSGYGEDYINFVNSVDRIRKTFNKKG